jgi:hypothetical protein
VGLRGSAQRIAANITESGFTALVLMHFATSRGDSRGAPACSSVMRKVDPVILP